MTKGKKRVMWLLNHTSARKFEVPMLKYIGFDEVFLPKTFPTDPGFRSASIEWSEDENLTIPAEDLKILNNADWYRGAGQAAWDIANKWFDTVFFILYDIELLRNISLYFHGNAVWRVYGLSKPLTYTDILLMLSEGKGASYIRNLGDRFFFGVAYEHLNNIENDALKKRTMYLPLGLKNSEINDQWSGEHNKIMFVCPDIAINEYYESVYKEFISDFSDFEYIICGSQPIKVMDKHVIGFVSHDEHINNMQKTKLMFYHSREEYHIHYHPFEAVKAGMPLIFMAGGLLDRLGGKNLPGRCVSIKEARKKIKKIMNGDLKLIQEIKQSQKILMKAMDFDELKQHWLDNFTRLSVISQKNQTNNSVQKRKKVAVILPEKYSGGSLRGALLLANAIKNGSLACGDKCQVIFYHRDDSMYTQDALASLDSEILVRSFEWKIIDFNYAKRSMAYAGYEGWRPVYNEYCVPDDGINYAYDCDLWLIVSDRMMAPILPVKPIVLMIYDYLQRRNDFLHSSANLSFISAARQANKVLVTTDFTYNDALNYAGVKKEKIRKVPMLIPDFSSGHHVELDDVRKGKNSLDKRKYFLWTTNSSPHKNFNKVTQALRLYYEVYDGQLECIVTGVNTKSLDTIQSFDSNSPWNENDMNPGVKIKFRGNLPDSEYKRLLESAKFLLHSSHGDNVTFSVVEAAYFGVPVLSNRYPAIEEMDEFFQLSLTYFDVFDIDNFARKLKWMESHYCDMTQKLPPVELLNKKADDNVASKYWDELRGLL